MKPRAWTTLLVMFVVVALCAAAQELSPPIGAARIKPPLLLGAAPAMAYVNMGIVAIFATVIAYYLLPVALRRLRPTTVSMYSNLQPLVTAALAIAVGQDVFTWNKPVALILVIFGVFLVTTSRAKDDVRRETGDVRRET